LGESALIERIAARIGPAPRGETWSGDDAAVLPFSGRTILYTTDVMVEGVDFDRAYCSGTDVGFKSVAINASDIAAMGGAPRHAVAALSLPPETSVSFVDAMVDGVVEASKRWSIGVAGGDISRAHEVSMAMAMIGAPFGDAVVHRSGAKAGDALCVTGHLGGAGGGLKALSRGIDVTGSAALAGLAARHLRPSARVVEAKRLCELHPTAMIDVSDGLAVDLWHLMDASGTGCDVDPAAVPVDPRLAELADLLSDDTIDPLDLALLGGEDFELLFRIDPDKVGRAQTALAELGCAVTRLGSVTENVSERRIGDHDLEELKEAGWDHLRTG
jgi:thiamine-monophosphate kinase